MKKIILLTFVLFGIFNLSQAQMHYMPDSMLKVKLTNLGYGSCITGDSIDASCSAIAGVTDLKISNFNIHNTAGVEAFPALIKLVCDTNLPLTIPALPVTLETLIARNCGISSLPFLPNELRYLDVNNDSLVTLSSLPDSLRELICSYNKLISLPVLPDSLINLDCGNNPLVSLPVLPSRLIYLIFSNTGVRIMPTLPDSLIRLDFGYDSIPSFPFCPSKLAILYANNNLLTSLPSLPNTLSALVSSYNPLTSFPSILPPILSLLECVSNNISNLPPLPTVLFALRCDINNINTLPVLPPALQTLSCSHNNLSSLPTIPNSLLNLYCPSNQITILPPLPASMNFLQCDSNLLSSLPEFPDSLFICDISSNPNLYCLPRLKRIYRFNYQNCPISCLPNYGNVNISYPQLSLLPLCDPLNTNGCNFFWNISGKVYFDKDSNCVQSNTEYGVNYIHLNLYDNGVLTQQTFTVEEGRYSFDTYNFSTYQTELDTVNFPFVTTCPSSGRYTDTLSVSDSLVYNDDFGLKCKNGFDVGAWSIVTTELHPNHRSNVHINAGDLANFYGVHCANGDSGIITVNINGNAHYITSLPGTLTPSSATGNTVIYNIADFGTIYSQSSFGFEIETDTNAIAGSFICFDVFVTSSPGDYNASNDFLSMCFPVYASFDPNDKEVYPSGIIDTSQHWLTYTIRFQNTGNAPAENIYILDTLDNDLDISTFQLLSLSHNGFAQIMEGGILKISFSQINLPDSFSNEPLSHGYIQYKIKIKDGSALGTQINNTAHIYFDFNQPIVTNTTSNTISTITSIRPVTESMQIKIFPSPFRDEFTIEGMSGNSTISICDLSGKLIYSEVSKESYKQIRLENLDSGIYFLKIKNVTGEVIRKIIKL